MIYIHTVYLLYTFDEINNILETCKKQQNSAYLLFLTFSRSLHRIDCTRNSLPTVFSCLRTVIREELSRDPIRAHLLRSNIKNTPVNNTIYDNKHCVFFFFNPSQWKEGKKKVVVICLEGINSHRLLRFSTSCATCSLSTSFCARKHASSARGQAVVEKPVKETSLSVSFFTSIERIHHDSLSLSRHRLPCR